MQANLSNTITATWVSDKETAHVVSVGFKAPPLLGTWATWD